MNQATTPFTVLFSLLVLGTRYTCVEIGSVVIIVGAAVGAVFLSKSGGGGDDSVYWATFAAVTTSFAALAFVLKEMTFADFRLFASNEVSQNTFGISLGAVDVRDPSNEAPTEDLQLTSSQEPFPDRDVHHPPEELSVFIVGTFTNLIGMLVAIPLALLNQYMTDSGPGWSELLRGMRFLCLGERDGYSAIFVYAVYIAFNILFNLALLLLTAHGSALLSFMSLKLCVPLVALLSSVSWPVIGPRPVNAASWGVLLLMACGITFFRVGTMQRQRRKLSCCWPLL